MIGTRRLLRTALLALCALGLVQAAAGALVPAKAVLAQLLLARAFDRSRATHRPQRPWPWADMTPVARVRVPRLRIEQVVLDAGSGQAMAFGPTLLPGGAPLGRSGTSVLAAHRDTHFRFLEQVRPGDTILIDTMRGDHLAYRVTDARIVRWDRFAIPRNGGIGKLALATCYPFGGLGHGSLRYVVQATAA